MGAPDFLDERSSKFGLFLVFFWRESSKGGRMSLGRDLLGFLSWTYSAHYSGGTKIIDDHSHSRKKKKINSVNKVLNCFSRNKEGSHVEYLSEETRTIIEAVDDTRVREDRIFYYYS